MVVGWLGVVAADERNEDDDDDDEEDEDEEADEGVGELSISWCEVNGGGGGGGAIGVWWRRPVVRVWWQERDDVDADEMDEDEEALVDA